MLVGFSADNHPQQTGKRGAVDAVDDRGTPWEFVRSLEARTTPCYWGPFDLDVAAAPHNAKAPLYFTAEDDGLAQDWNLGPGTGGDLNIWCNPPYSDCGAWVRKSWEQWNDPRIKPHLIAMLLPANRTEQAWWQDLVEPHRDRPGSPLRVEFLRGRMRFDRPGWTKPAKGDRPPFGCCLLIWERTDLRAALRAGEGT